MFVDSEFMTAREKQRVVKDWRRFLHGGLTQTLLTPRLYAHLYQHCGFMSSYDQVGFFEEHFKSAAAVERFFERFNHQTGGFFRMPDMRTSTGPCETPLKPIVPLSKNISRRKRTGNWPVWKPGWPRPDRMNVLPGNWPG